MALLRHLPIPAWPLPPGPDAPNLPAAAAAARP
jgi:hypothetical protein